jgi:hypothetical protein
VSFCIKQMSILVYGSNESDRNFLTPLQTQQSLDLTFDDSGAFDINTEILAFTNLDDSIVIHPPHLQSFADFDLRR